MAEPTQNERPCDWCGHRHAVTALCTERPKWSRRGFIALCGAALAGTLVPSFPTTDAAPEATRMFILHYAKTFEVEPTWEAASQLFLATWTDGGNFSRLLVERDTEPTVDPVNVRGGQR